MRRMLLAENKDATRTKEQLSQKLHDLSSQYLRVKAGERWLVQEQENIQQELQGIEVKTAVLYKKLVTVKELQGIMDAINKIAELKKDVVTTEELDKIIVEIKKLYFEQELKDIKPKMQEFDQLYYGRKNKFSKLKTNFLAALGNLDTGTVSICFRNMYSNYMKNFSDNKGLEDSLKNINKRNKEFWKLNPIVIKVGDQEKKYTFNEFFMDGFIKIQSEKHQDGTGSNFSSQQKQSMGIINFVDKTEEKDEQNAQNIKVTKVEQYTPEYMLKNLPLLLEQFHCADDQLENEMKKVGLFDLTLKFDKNKKSLERFIDSKKLINAENTVLDANERRTRAEINEENHRYFKAVKKLFCVKADNIVENADLVFETETQNKLRITSSQSIQREFNSKLKSLTQKEEDDVTNCLDKKAIIANWQNMNTVPREHFLFFCGDWICHSSKFLSEDISLENFKNIVKKRIEFGCRGQGLNKLQLNDETYNLLTALTLLSGLEAANKLKDIDKTVIEEICFLITGKKKDFSLDDANLIMSVTRCLGNSGKSVAESIVKNTIENQDCKYALIFIKAFDVVHKLSHDQKIEFINCIGDRDEEIDFMEVVSAINKSNFYPYYGNDYDYAAYGHKKAKLSFKFMRKLMKQISQKYQFGVFPNEQQKEILGIFLEKFIVDNNEFGKNEQEVFNFFKALMEKVPPEKSKEVTEEIIKICSNLRENSQRAAILKYVLDASKNSLEGLELMEVLEQHDYARGFILYTENGVQKGIEPIEFDYSLIEKLISDIIEKPLPLTKKEVQRLEWFCTNCYRKDKCKTNNLQFGDIQDIQRKEAKLFFSLIDKMPKGSMSIDMFKNLVAHFFPSLASNIKDKDNSDTIQKIQLNLMLFYYSWDSREYLYHNKDIDDKDVILNPHIVSRLAYVLPQDKLKEIISLEESCSRYDSDYHNNLEEYKEEYNYCHRRYTKYCILNQSSNNSNMADTTNEFQRTEKEDRYKYRQEEEKEAEREEAKKEGTKKMITAFNKLDVNKIKKIQKWTEFKQKCKSAKKREKKNNDGNINNSVKGLKQDDNNNNNNIINFEQNQNLININQNKEIKIEEKREENIIGGIDSKNENGINPQQAQPNSTDKDKNYFINFDVKTDKNHVGNNNPNSDNPYTLSAWCGLLPIVPSIIFVVKIKINQRKLTGGYIALIIVGIFPVISAIVFGIMALVYNQNNLAKKTQENLKYACNINENDNNIEEKENENNKGGKISPINLIVNSEQNQNQNQQEQKDKS